MLIITFFLLIGHNLCANTYRVYGKLRDLDSKQPIEFATIAVKHFESDSIATSMITDSKGEFSFEIKPGEYRLDIRCLGFKAHVETIEVIDKDLYLKPIEMRVELTQLSEVSVIGSSYNERFDRSIQNVTKQFKEGTNDVKDLLSKIRGINVDPLDNSIKVDNAKNVLLLVDGIKKEQAYVKNLPPDRVARIEVTRNPTGRYISEGYSAVINIILKKNYTGYDLMLEEQGFYSLDKSNGDDFLFKNQASANLTYTIKTINLYGSYSNVKTNTNLLVENSKELANSSLVQKAPAGVPNIERNALTHAYLLGADFFINANQTLSFETNLIRSPFSQNNTTQTYNDVFSNNNSNEDFFSQLNNAQSNNEHYSLLSYRYEISEKNKLELDYGYNHAKSVAHNIYSEDNQERSKQEMQSKWNTSILDLNFKHVFDETYSIEFGYRNTYRIYRYLFLLPDVLREKNKDVRNLAYAYLSIAPKSKSKIKSKIGIATEQNTLTVNNHSKNYYSLQPFLSVYYKQSQNMNVTLKLNSDSDYPYTSQVSPFETTTDRLTIETGNPDLSFATKYIGSLDFKLFKNKLSIEPYYSVTKNHISRTGNVVNEQFQYTYSNLDKYESAGVKMSTRIALIPNQMFFNFSGSVFFDKTEFNGYANKINDFVINSNLMYLHPKHKTLCALMLKKMNAKQIQAYGYSSNDNDYLGLFAKQSFFSQKLVLSALYILPVQTGLNYSMKDHFKHDSFREDNKTNVEVLTNLFMLKLSLKLSKGSEIQSVEKKNYKEKKVSKSLF